MSGSQWSLPKDISGGGYRGLVAGDREARSGGGG